MSSVLKPAKFVDSAASAATMFFVTAALAAVTLSTAATAVAEPVPGPDPVPVPGVVGAEEGGGCVTGQVLKDDTCVSAVVSPETGGETRVSAPTIGGVETSTTNSYLDPMHTVPNLNGDPCTGQWESTACYAMNFDSAPSVQPRSTLSSSP